MIKNLNKDSNLNRKDDMKILIWIIVGFLFVAWLCTPPGNKFLQVCFWGNNTKLFVTRLTNNSAATEYIFHRNNAVYLAKMYQNKSRALIEMNKAIETIPAFVNENELTTLYKERAYIRLQAGDFKGALNDFINSKNITFSEYLTVAMLFNEIGNYREALTYCNAILNTDSTAYAGFACLAEVYSTIGRHDVGVRVWDLAIDRRPNFPKAYVDRAILKKKLGDYEGYHADIKKARELSPAIETENTYIYDTLHPKILTLSIK